MDNKNKKAAATVSINAEDNTVGTLRAQIESLTTERDQAVTIANYTASLLLKTESSLNNTLLKVANIESPKKLSFIWVLRNWKVIAELLESIWLLIKEFRQNIKFENEPNPSESKA